MTTPPILKNESLRTTTIDQFELMDDTKVDAFERIVDLVALATGINIALFSVVREDQQFFKAKRGLATTGTSRGRSFCAWAIASEDQDSIFVVNDARDDPRFAENPLVVEDPYIRFYAGLPVRAPNGIVVGTTCVIDSQAQELSPVTERVLRAARALLEEALLLQSSSVRDHLTGLFNRRHFDESLDREWRRALRKMLPLTVMLGDIDHFKSYNDRYGHIAGDSALKAVANVIEGDIRRAGDLIARYGGEEFVFILPETDAQGAQIVADKLVRSVSEAGIEHEDGINGRLTMSVGAYVALDKTDLALGQLEILKLADRALYDAKEAGRNRAVTHVSDTATPQTETGLAKT